MGNKEFVKENKLEDQAVEIVAMTMTSDPKETFDKKSLMSLAGSDMSALAAN